MRITEGITLTDEQEEAFDQCTSLSSKIFIITGKPGTGKTTLAFWIVDHYRNRGVALCAPTGRAAKRLAEKTGRSASTIHRLLGFNPSGEWKYNSYNPLPHKVVVVDESSMIDIFLFRRLLDALPKDAILIMSGDPYQLPPVGPGAPFRDLINSKVVPSFELQQIHRQAMDNYIIIAAHAILNGDPDVIEWDGERQDFQLISMGTDVPASEIISYIETELVNTKHLYNLQYLDTQVLCPQKKGDIGTKTLNQRFQQTFNPPSVSKYEYKGTTYTYREGDRVIQMVNDYKLGIFNGDLGTITRIFSPQEIADQLKDVTITDNPYSDAERNKEQIKELPTIMQVKFDDAEDEHDVLDIPKRGVNNLALAYGLTIHKSQGSEYPLVIIPCHRSNHWMWCRPLLYTAVTRAKQHCILVGDMSMVTKAIKETREDSRNTYLRERLQGTG